MKYCFIILFFFPIILYSQVKSTRDFGYRHFKIEYNNDSVDILVKSKQGEENIQKPLFFFCQGSLPIPLIKYNGSEVYGVFPFNPDSLTEKYH